MCCRSLSQRFDPTSIPHDYASIPPARQGWASKETGLKARWQFILARFSGVALLARA